MTKVNDKIEYNGYLIPGDWSLEKLGAFGNTYNGITGKSKEDFGHGKPYIPYLNIFNNSIIQNGDFDLVNIKPNESQSLVEHGDLFFTTSSETPDEVGMCSVYLGNETELYLNSFCFGFRPFQKDRIDTEFIAHLFRSALGRRIIYKLAQGSTRYNISKTNLLLEKIPLPPLREQKAITHVLSTWDGVIHKTEKLVAQKELGKKWLMKNLLTGKKRLKGFKGEWSSVMISNFFKPTDRYIEWKEENLYNLISIRRRNGGVFLREPLYGYQIGVKKLKTVLLDDFVISKRQVSHGAWAVIEPEFNQTKVSDEYDCLEISDKRKITTEFWKWYCQIPILTHYANVDSDGVHIEKSIFDYDLFKRRKVVIPDSIEEQTAIAKVLQATDKEINLLKSKAEKLREQKKGLMQQLLTGKNRLKINDR